MKQIISFYVEAGRIAVQSILAHKLRAFLTLIGIIIGVASVVVVGASISGFNGYVVNTVSKMLGVNHFMMARFAKQGGYSEEEWEKVQRRNKVLEISDYEWMREHCDTCMEVGATAQRGMDLRQDGRDQFGVQVRGVTANMMEIEDKTISEGRFLTRYEVDHAGQVCVIGYDLKDKFFDGRDAVGKTLKFAGVPLTVVGVEEKKGTFLGQSLDNIAYIPLTTYGQMFGRTQNLQIHGEARELETFHVDDRGCAS